MNKCALLPFAFLALTAAGAPPDLGHVSVNLPYSELKNLWTAAQREDAKPPVGAVLLAARYQLALKDGQATGVAEFETESFTSDWTVTRLLGMQAQIESIEPADARVITRDGYYALLANRPGRQKITIRFAAALSSSAEGVRLQLPIAPASINTLAVAGIPGGEALRVAGATRISAEKEGAVYRLAPEDHLELSLGKAAVPSRWKIEPQAFVRLADGKLMYEMRIAAHTGEGSGLSMDLEFPPDANVSNVTGDGLDGWQMKGREAHITWRTPGILRRELTLLYDLPQPLTAAEWKLRGPRILDGESSPPLYLLALEPGLEITAAENPAPRQLPKWLEERAGDTLAVVGDQPLGARWLPLVQTARAVVETARADMRVVTDGAALTEAVYAIRHEAACSWKLSLPEGSELLACSVDDRPASPVNLGGHAVEFSLPAGKAVDEVKLTYTSKVEAFKPVSGKIAIDLPETGLLTNRLDWELHIPAAYEAAAFEGNVEPGQGDAGAIHLHREIFKGERPAAQLFYKKPEAK